MYWSIAGLDENLVRNLFSETNSILKKGGAFIFDTENAEGIKENLLNVPFIDAYFPDGKDAVIEKRTLAQRWQVIWLTGTHTISSKPMECLN